MIAAGEGGFKPRIGRGRLSSRWRGAAIPRHPGAKIEAYAALQDERRSGVVPVKKVTPFAWNAARSVRRVEFATGVLPLVVAVPVERLPRAGTSGGHR